MLTKEASNAVLKTLEEPPDHVVFVLCTTEMQAMLPTIRSRCQRFAFFRPTHAETSEVLQRISEAEAIEIDEAAIAMVARAAAAASATRSRCSTSCARRARSGSPPTTRGRCWALPTRRRCSRRSTWSRPATPPARCGWSTSWPSRAPTWPTVRPGLVGHLRGLFSDQQLGAPPADLALTAEEQAAAVRAGRAGDADQPCTRLIDLLREVVDEVKEGSDPRLPLELSLVRVCRPQVELSLEALPQRLERLEAGRDRARARPPVAPPAPALRSHPTSSRPAPMPRRPQAAPAAPPAGDGRAGGSTSAGRTRCCPRSAAARRRSARCWASARPAGRERRRRHRLPRPGFRHGSRRRRPRTQALLTEAGQARPDGRCGWFGRPRRASARRRRADRREQRPSRLRGRAVRPDQAGVRRPRGEGADVSMDPNKMMAQLGKMQQQMERTQEELKTSFVEHSAGRRRRHREDVGRARGQPRSRSSRRRSTPTTPRCSRTCSSRP